MYCRSSSVRILSFLKKRVIAMLLRADIHDLVAQYARLVDNDEFERVRALVESIRRDSSRAARRGHS